MSTADDNLADAILKLNVNESPENDSLSNPVFDRTFPSFEPLTQDPDFVKEECNSSLALLNNQFFETHEKQDKFQSMYERANKWFEGTNTSEEQLKAIEESYRKSVEALIAKEDAQFERIFLRDADRTFNTLKRKTALCHILTYLQDSTLQGDYHQGLSMMVSFLHCFLSAPKVIAMAIHANEKLIPGVWKSRSVTSAVDGYVIYELLQREKPLIHKHLLSKHIIPELFVSKFWCATSVHLLPFQSLVCLYDDFWGELGVLAFFELVFRTILGQEEAILKAASIDKALELISLDHKVLSCEQVNTLTYHFPLEEVQATPEDSETPEKDKKDDKDNDTTVKAPKAPEYVVQTTKMIASLRDKDELEKLRSSAFATHIQPRIERTERDFSKPKDPDCQRPECEDSKETGFYYCLECKIHLCEDCAYSSWGDHNEDDHTVRLNEDVDEDEK